MQRPQMVVAAGIDFGSTWIHTYVRLRDPYDLSGPVRNVYRWYIYDVVNDAKAAIDHVLSYVQNQQSRGVRKIGYTGEVPKALHALAGMEKNAREAVVLRRASLRWKRSSVPELMCICAAGLNALSLYAHPSYDIQTPCMLVDVGTQIRIITMEEIGKGEPQEYSTELYNTQRSLMEHLYLNTMRGTLPTDDYWPEIRDRWAELLQENLIDIIRRSKIQRAGDQLSVYVVGGLFDLLPTSVLTQLNEELRWYRISLVVPPLASYAGAVGAAMVTAPPHKP